ncbi:hypothetical protein GDO81_001054 [Engystomops pustulosus]|uniref:Uncharacterized protein n=1 Tax=Engystomops pustulosus TaxID=76066 RepID=A0AAV7D9D3_ENGPU|nr:hypothetical protein GDO81_001054 [Engystomops pustulosus]
MLLPFLYRWKLEIIQKARSQEYRKEIIPGVSFCLAMQVSNMLFAIVTVPSPNWAIIACLNLKYSKPQNRKNNPPDQTLLSCSNVFK